MSETAGMVCTTSPMDDVLTMRIFIGSGAAYQPDWSPRRGPGPTDPRLRRDDEREPSTLRYGRDALAASAISCSNARPRCDTSITLAP